MARAGRGRARRRDDEASPSLPAILVALDGPSIHLRRWTDTCYLAHSWRARVPQCGRRRCTITLDGNAIGPKAFGSPSFGFAGYTHSPRTKSARGGGYRSSRRLDFGAASTWVAAESSDGHFIQLGTTENVTGRTQSFNVFWSDPVVHFEPQSIGVVAAGDVISYSMTKTSSGWVLRFRDRTTSQSRRVTVPYGQTTSFDEGQWIQEDPTFSNFSEHLPYPQMSLVTFSHLKLNGRIPTLRFTYAQAMSTSNGVSLIPSKVRHNSFTFHHAKGDALQYLRDALRSTPRCTPSTRTCRTMSHLRPSRCKT